MKIGLIVDHGTIAAWQAETLWTLVQDNEFAVYRCLNTRRSRRLARHAFYYLLNLLALRTRLTKRTPLPADLKVVSEVSFASELDGNWQRLPDSLLERINQDRPDFILKFGMGLLRIPSKSDLAVPILSYHHGNPSEFRGRPAGFYELMQGRDTVGQVIQILSNELDAGKVVAFGETKAHPYSYRATMLEAYRCSPLLLRMAIRNLASGKSVPLRVAPKAYRLPSNATVVRFVGQRLAEHFKRLVYGAFIEKIWQVAEAPLTSETQIIELSDFPRPDQWQLLERPRGYRFLADPFYDPSGSGVLVEALRRSSGLGEILRLDGSGATVLSDRQGHYSYPGTFSHAGERYVLPEMSEWSAPKLYRLAESRLEELGALNVPGSQRLLDPTLHAEDSKIFLFANCATEGGSVLRLWVSDALTAPFEEHPASPICVSPAGGRMAGAILGSGNARFRFGQENQREYGDGVVLFRIERLSADEYDEVRVGELRFDQCHGPHTINARQGSVLFDWYRNRISLLAGARRFRSSLARRP